MNTEVSVETTEDKQDPKHTLKFAPSILSRLGEELLPNFDQGIIELVRNSYDADALKCTVTLNNIMDPGGSIFIEDNGIGMDESSISNGWLVLGHSSKRDAGTTKRGRIQVGDKGLGRLAALRMGKVATLTSRPRISDDSLNADTEYFTQLEWSLFDEKQTVDEVNINVESTTIDNKTLAGTEINILDLKKKITKPEAERLARSLMLLSNPFKEENDFKLIFKCKDYPELERLVNEGYLSEAEFTIKATLDDNGKATAKVLDWKNEVLWETTSTDWFTNNKKEANPVYDSPRAEFELAIFQLEGSNFATRSINKSQVSSWLKAVGGVHIYHNDFRVHPYGDAGSDWLDMNLARVNAPSIRPSTNTSVGKVRVFDTDKRLQQKTDRVGFIEDNTFEELKRFVKDCLNWYALKRTQLSEQKKRAAKDRDAEYVKEKKSELNKIIKTVKDTETQKQIKKAVKAASIATEKQTRHLQEDLKLYRSLATAGTTTAVFSHEISKPLVEIPVSLRSAERIIEEHCEKNIFGRYKRRTNNILSYLNRLSHFAELQLDLLKRNKRRDGVIDVNFTLSTLVNNFKPLLEREEITLDFNFDSNKKSKLNGSVCILEAIVTNCLTNSMRAFQSEGYDIDERKIEILLKQVQNKLTMEIHDNGPGIKDISTDEIWLPGMTTMENGTGFGLTIVRDSVSDLSGSCRVEPTGKLNGASFYFEFRTL
ncbi:TPA: ATP-binding protein [Vibrio parahaemolyticus]|uniref:sensor histidine kinase n=4 Tax=Vibrio parahaemolyticus TaxID=670 RepID=UPI001A8E1845|nr:sensor histidine kinase [Vibrio parahaemolyticus]MBE4474932.1 sensor histidine kinase [Vibrio parahaemolyticus]MBO0155604.1 sensor histidine kinase [Vibrio parahaemolyticus]MBO0170823.1 sensor histidine kinase [Vibrio parahaemolyticus]MCX8858581.1 ATP-binding protein [Vibrio parahaemolyticus]MCX8864257.1 ATP-binding protein [Vibrio parahaemolyticus]